MQRSSIFAGAAGLAAVACLLAGCGGGSGHSTAHLKGAVTIDGRAIPADVLASISFHPTRLDQGSMADVLIIDGKYDAPAVPRGPVKVHISVKQFTGRMITGLGEPAKEYASLVPPQYESGLAQEVIGDNLHQDFNLTK